MSPLGTVKHWDYQFKLLLLLSRGSSLSFMCLIIIIKLIAHTNNNISDFLIVLNTIFAIDLLMILGA